MENYLNPSTSALIQNQAAITSLLNKAESQISSTIENTPDMVLTFKVPDFENDKFLANMAEAVFNLNKIKDKLPNTFTNYKRTIELYHNVFVYLIDQVKRAQTITWTD